MPKLDQVPTSVTLSAEQFEKLYLNPMMHRQSPLTRKLGNPTPLALGAFVVTATPLSCCLMEWRGAGGGGAAFTGVLILFGGLLLIISSILEFVIGNTFPSVVFGHLGAFCLAFGATMTPAYNAAAPYSETMTDTIAGLHSPGFLNTFAFFLVSMALLMLIYAICALRTNLIFLVMFIAMIFCFSLLAAAYWRMALGDLLISNRLSVAGGAILFAVAMLGFYLLAAQLFDSVGLSLSLPIGDLSHLWDRKEIGEYEYPAAGGDPR
ncbi:GPR1/FUN34/yaaH family-domain-containing protein [Aspergillus pseudonomiae]|uniref:GPR1/FUN34/yaaH family-domain-containing protein n=1 Tax=Aspergillus pseudonomiae TaxID=1506151 RepID=A0A5N7DLP2_9EURO|nr:GPR1/FUN34/yaaH family-domain-containing protein [Aspergillus pseudonomiae]KAE8406398.1 GPR1/FUN34/yaaH family-domain-containing protein [Aspergillus pseudonomiae]